MKNKEKKEEVIFVIEQEGGFCEDSHNDVYTSPDVKKTITKDYKKGVQKTITKVKIKPFDLDKLERSGTNRNSK